MRGRDGTSGVDWTQGHRDRLRAAAVAAVRLHLAAVLLLVLKFIVRNPALYAAPEGNKPPPLWIRGILIADLHRRQLRARLQRRPEGHGPDHADPDRHGADRLRAEPRAAGIARWRSSRRPRTPPPRWSPPRAPATASSAIPRPAVTQYVATRTDQRRHLSLAGRAGEGRRRPGREIRLAEQGAGGSRRQHPQRHVPDFGSDPLPDEGQGKRPEQGRGRHPQRLQGLARLSHQVHPDSGSRSRSRSRSASAP